jgi:peptidoglycan/LPS O-acetylase OafA/YrhL
MASSPPADPVRLEARSSRLAIAGWFGAVAIGLAVGSEAAVSSLTVPGRPAVEAALFTLVGLGSVGLVGLAVSRAPGAAGRVLRMRWLRSLGKISYGLYIYHVPIFLFVMNAVGARFGTAAPLSIKVLRSVVEIGLTLGVASVSWRFLERPLLSLKSRL